MNSKSMEIKLSVEKISKIRTKVHHLLATQNVTSLIPGNIKCNQPSPSDGTTVLLLASDIRLGCQLQVKNQAFSIGHGRPAMVGRIHHHLE